MNSEKKMRVTLLLPLVALLCCGSAMAQDYKWDQIDDLDVKFQVFKKLGRLPLKFGDNDPHLRARYEPDGAGDYINGRRGTFSWSFNVYEFPKQAKLAATGKQEDKPKTAREQAEESALAKSRSANFSIFVTEKDRGAKNRKFVKKDEAVPTKGKKLGFKWYEYTDVLPMSGGGGSFDQLWYSFAAAYDLPEREIALVVTVPVQRGDTPADKHRGWAETMTRSLALLKGGDSADEDAGDAKKDQFADTDAKRAELAKAKANIGDLPWWDYFTTPHYIVLFSWPQDKKEKAPEALKKAKSLASDMERMYAMYEQYYPPHEKMAEYYSVMRICSNYDEFSKYGETRGGVVGWFSPATKELVFFLGDRLGGKGFTNAVAFHEGWHQYCDRYFGTELQRWFDEGTGDWFGSFTWAGTKWQYQVSKMRRLEVKDFIRSKEYPPVKELVKWNKDKFYGSAKTSDYYAQAYSIIDFLRNGKANKANWDPAWEKVLETYGKTALETKNAIKAVEAAFQGVDFDKFEAAWLKWVDGY